MEIAESAADRCTLLQKCFFSTFQMKCPMSIRVRCKDDETLEIMNITMRFQGQLSTTCFTKVVSTEKVQTCVFYHMTYDSIVKT
jgi:hypothetical protein